ncbi:MAG: hypothetical protein PHU66_05600 [Bacteroidaceae bacterium]|nr:hypothetical protein [Bacteroidaceae bacterium]
MKAIKLILACIFCLAFTVNTNAQFLEKIAKKAQKKVERESEKRTERRVNKGIDNVFDKAEEGIDNTVKNMEKNKRQNPTRKEHPLKLPITNQAATHRNLFSRGQSTTLCPAPKSFLKMIYNANKTANSPVNGTWYPGL